MVFFFFIAVPPPIFFMVVFLVIIFFPGCAGIVITPLFMTVASTNLWIAVAFNTAITLACHSTGPPSPHLVLCAQYLADNLVFGAGP